MNSYIFNRLDYVRRPSVDNPVGRIMLNFFGGCLFAGGALPAHRMCSGSFVLVGGSDPQLSRGAPER